MNVYVAQITQPTDFDVLYGPIVAVGSEWNRIMHEIMTHYNLDQYVEKRRMAQDHWRIHIDGDLYIDVIKVLVDGEFREN